MNEHTKEPWWRNKSRVLVVVIIVAVVIVALGGGRGSNVNTAQDSDLRASVKSSLTGLEITNREQTDWTDCYVGVNGPTGWDFDKPAYRTHGAFWLGKDVIPASSTVNVSYRNLTNENGDRFDIETHAVNTILVDCFNDTRSWTGEKR